MSNASAPSPISDKIELLRARIERYKRLAENQFDRSVSQEVARFAEELEAEIVNLETQHLLLSIHMREMLLNPKVAPIAADPGSRQVDDAPSWQGGHGLARAGSNLAR